MPPQDQPQQTPPDGSKPATQTPRTIDDIYTPPPQKSKGKSPMKLVIFGAAGFIVLMFVIALLASAGTKKKADTTSSATTDATAVKDTSGTFSITPPKDWTQDATPQVGSIMSFSKPAGLAKPILATSLAITKQTVTKETVDKFADTAALTLKAQFTNFSQNKRDKVKVGDQTAYLISSKFNMVDTKFQSMQLIVIKDKVGYVITAIGQDDTWNQDKDSIKTSLLSFQP